MDIIRNMKLRQLLKDLHLLCQPLEQENDYILGQILEMKWKHKRDLFSQQNPCNQKTNLLNKKQSITKKKIIIN